MKKLELSIVDFFYSDETWKEDKIEKIAELGKTGAESILENNIDCFFANKEEFREYCNLYAKLLGKKPFAVLDAHGVVRRAWEYRDQGKLRSMQGWINAHENDYGTLLLNVCNEPGIKARIPESKNAILVFSNGLTCLGKPEYGIAEFNFEFYIPKIGIVDGYEIDYRLNQLKASTKKS